MADLDQIKEKLVRAGLSLSEVKVYLSLLELGPQGATELARKSGVQRSNVYYFLDSLREKGLVSQMTRETGVKYFQAEKPRRVLTYLEQQKNNLDQIAAGYQKILPDIEDLRRKYSLIHPNVRFYDSIEGIRQFYEEVFESGEFMAFADIEAVAKHYPDYVWGLIERGKKEKITARELVIDSATARKYKASIKSHKHKVKILPKKYSFTADIVLYENRTALISYKKILSAFSIEDEMIHHAQRALFEALWQRIK